MEKFKRNERIGGIMKILTERPNQVFTYNYFTDMFNAAKSTISEDIVIVKDLVSKLEFGSIQTISGASGGVKFIPKMTKEQSVNILEEIKCRIESSERFNIGGFLYMKDILYSPDIVYDIGNIFASKFIDENVDYVATVETKGIPIAMMTAKALNVPLAIMRKNNSKIEGPTISINYVSGSTKKIQTMSLSKRELKEGSKVLIIDDFMKGGGTARGISEMVREFKGEVVGIGVMIATKEPKSKLIENYTALFEMDNTEEDDKKIKIEIVK